MLTLAFWWKTGAQGDRKLAQGHIASKWPSQSVNPGSEALESKGFLKASPEATVLSPGQPWTHAEGVCPRVRPAKTETVARFFKSQGLSLCKSGGENALDVTSPRWELWGRLTLFLVTKSCIIKNIPKQSFQMFLSKKCYGGIA